MSGSDEDQQTHDDFSEAVNMTGKELRDWLETDESGEVGQKSGDDSESTGHEYGRRILKLLDTKKADLRADDYAAMRKVVDYVHRHLKQRPSGDVTDTPWRYSLMNWGHDPEK